MDRDCRRQSRFFMIFHWFSLVLETFFDLETNEILVENQWSALIFHFCRCHWEKSFESQTWSLILSRYVWQSFRWDLFESAIFFCEIYISNIFLVLEIGIFGIFTSGDVPVPRWRERVDIQGVNLYKKMVPPLWRSPFSPIFVAFSLPFRSLASRFLRSRLLFKPNLVTN